jgi:serine/threonine protein kinase
MADEKLPSITDISQLSVNNSTNLKTGTLATVWTHFTADDKAYIGRSHQSQFELELADFVAGLEQVPDDAIYPKIPAGTHITIAPESLYDGAVFIKRMAFRRIQRFGTGITFGEEEGLTEALAMEKISKTPHPYIVRYHGCRIQRGRITRIVLENLRDSLSAKIDQIAKEIDKEAFLAGVESAIQFLHSLGLAHNDLNPDNIMVREADDGSFTPVLIDFGSCAPFGARIHGRCPPDFMDLEDKEPFISRARHDEFALKRLYEWWDKDHVKEKHDILRRLRDMVAAHRLKQSKKRESVDDMDDTKDTEDDVEDTEHPKA